jgi:hypothetical protein
MNAMGGMFKDEKRRGNCQKKITFVIGSSTYFQSSRIHNNISANSVIEKLQKIAREKEA